MILVLLNMTTELLWCCRSQDNDARGQSEEGSQHQDTEDGSIPDGDEPTEPVTETTEVLSEATSDGDSPLEVCDARQEPTETGNKAKPYECGPTEAVMEYEETLMETGGDGDPPMEAPEARHEPLETGNESTPDGCEPTEAVMETTEALKEPTGAP
ncbi:hypothetical protein R1sor_008855 [Riccia sorocarpa]|uniref:Uncharacterized protein n=1 Tax=Riccia sorocarpa TaxID=122646 RepID=A0ABD3H671_9MARC